MWALYLNKDAESGLYEFVQGWDDARMLGQLSGAVTDVDSLIAVRRRAGRFLKSERRNLNLTNGQLQRAERDKLATMSKAYEYLMSRVATLETQLVKVGHHNDLAARVGQLEEIVTRR